MKKTTKKRRPGSKSGGKGRAAKKPARKTAKKTTKKRTSASKSAGKSRSKRAKAPAKPRSRTRAPARSKGPVRSGKKAPKTRNQTPPPIRKGLPVTKAALRRLGRTQLEDRPEIKSIIVYTTDQKPKNLYPRKIISPPFPSKCCTDKNRVRVGKIYEELGRHYYYKVCKACGHAVKYYFNKETEFDTPRLRKYYEWKKSVFH